MRDDAPAPNRGDDGRAAPEAARAPFTLSRRAFLGLLGAGAVAGVAGTGVAGTYRFQVERIEASLDGLRAPVTIAWLCDLHYGPFIRAGSVAAWVDTTLALAPDVVLLGGDLVDTLAPPDVAPLVEQLGRLRAPLGVISIRGNHEYARFGRRGQLEAFEADLATVGIETFVNRGRLLRDDLWYAGVDDKQVGGAALRSSLAGRPDGTACVFGSHQPDVLPRLPDTVQLTFCGHTHGGQVRIPGLGPVVTRTRLGRDNEAGWVRVPALGYVSRGLGVVHVPLRLNCPAELTFATLRPA